MRSIRKGPEPRLLREHRASAGATYGNLTADALSAVRAQLANEQGFLCAYCMARIEPSGAGMKIEHWLPQSDETGGEAKQLDYRNLLGVCLGGMGRPRAQQHCDTSKGNQTLWSHPADPTHNPEPHLRYLTSGEVRSDDERVARDIETLNLNEASVLAPNRRAATQGFVDWIRAKGHSNPGSWSRETLERFLKELSRSDEKGRMSPFLGVGEYLLRKKLGRQR